MSYVSDIRQYVGHRPLILNGSVGLLFNHDGQLLLQQRAEPRQRWGLVGGLMELGESTSDVLLREVAEETGLQLSPEQLHFFKVYSGEKQRSVAPNGDIFYIVIAAYVVTEVAQAQQVSDGESLQLQWFDCAALPENMVGSHRAIIADYLAAH